MRLSHFAKLEVIVPKTLEEAALKTVGMAQNINVDDNFGSRAENTIGSPLPVLAPGYQQTTIRIEKATIDGDDFRNMGIFNPLWAHVGSTYKNPISLDTGGLNTEFADSASGMYPFMFILRVRNKISDSAKFSNIKQGELGTDGSDIEYFPKNGPAAKGEGGANAFGTYACVLQQATISASSQQAVIMDSVTAIARPITGTWLNEKLRDAFKDDKNGMATVIYDVLYGYTS